MPLPNFKTQCHSITQRAGPISNFSTKENTLGLDLDFQLKRVGAEIKFPKTKRATKTLQDEVLRCAGDQCALLTKKSVVL